MTEGNLVQVGQADLGRHLTHLHLLAIDHRHFEALLRPLKVLQEDVQHILRLYHQRTPDNSKKGGGLPYNLIKRF